MKLTLATIGIALALISPVSRAADEPKKPGPEHKKLEISAGKWLIEGASVESPLGPAGEIKGISEGRMILGGFFLEMRTEGTSPRGPFANFSVVAWDPDKSRYQESWFDSSGSFNPSWKADNAIFTIDGRKWNWSWTQEEKGKKYQVRQTITFSEDGKTSTAETSYSEDGASWKPLDKGKATKISG